MLLALKQLNHKQTSMPGSPAPSQMEGFEKNVCRSVLETGKSRLDIQSRKNYQERAHQLSLTVELEVIFLGLVCTY
jgi:hypothetical protein